MIYSDNKRKFFKIDYLVRNTTDNFEIYRKDNTVLVYILNYGAERFSLLDFKKIKLIQKSSLLMELLCL